jgi:hypothetical protein
VPHAVRLQCVDCLVRDAHRVRLPADAAAVGPFIDCRMMGSMEAFMVLQGLPRTSFAGIHGSGHMY